MHPDSIYHIYNHANGSENLFRQEENYRYFLGLWNKYIAPVAVTYAYCLMPNHFHALVRVHREEKLSDFFGDKLKLGDKDLTGFENLSGLITRQFSNLFNAYAKAYNKKYQRTGSLFNRPFKSKEIESEEYLTSIVRYIHHNPIHHGFCDEYWSWKFSSYNAYLTGKPSQINRDYILDWFGGVNEFISFHNINKRIPESSIETYLTGFRNLSGVSEPKI